MNIDQISARDIAVSGLKAQRTRMNFIANNIANAETTRTPDGGAFRRQVVIFRGEEIRRITNPERLGVSVKRIERDASPLRQVSWGGHLLYAVRLLPLCQWRRRPPRGYRLPPHAARRRHARGRGAPAAAQRRRR